MANKRMFTMKICDSDAFLDMPLSTQCLYFHLNMRADDDGFIGNTKRIIRLINASEDDLKILIAKRFVLVFDDGVIVIKHWRMHNTLSSQRYHETQYLDEKSSLLLKKNGSYSFTEGRAIDDTKTIEMFKNSDRRTSGEQAENADLDLDLDKDIDLGLDKESDKGQKNNVKRKTYFDDEELNKAFLDYIEMRKKLKKPMTERAIELAINKLENLSNGDTVTKIAILEQSIMNSWQGLFPLKAEQNNVKQKGNGLDWANA